MAHASTRTKLPLATWARIVGINPLHFSQVFFTSPNQRTTAICDSTLPQFTWQEADRISREEIAIAIADAEELIERYTGYRLLPSWEVDEWRPTPRIYKKEFFNGGVLDIRGLQQIVDAKWGYFVTGGIEAKELIDDAVAITYSDEDGDGYKETATVGPVAVTAGTDPCEIEAYYPGEAGEDEWQIRPISVSVVGAVATITFRRELAVLPDLTQGLIIASVDGADDANFLTTIDVYRRYNDPQTQVSFLWEPQSWCGACGGSGCVLCAYTTQTGCLHLRSEPRLSMVAYTPGAWNAETEVFDAEALAVARNPDLMRLFYYAGYRDMRKACPERDMDDGLARMVAYLAASLLDRPPCDCSSSMWGYWHEDLGKDQKFAVQSRRLNNPLGTRQGQVYVWSRLNDPKIRIGTGVLAGLH